MLSFLALQARLRAMRLEGKSVVLPTTELPQDWVYRMLREARKKPKPKLHVIPRDTSTEGNDS